MAARALCACGPSASNNRCNTMNEGREHTGGLQAAAVAHKHCSGICILAAESPSPFALLLQVVGLTWQAPLHFIATNDSAERGPLPPSSTHHSGTPTLADTTAREQQLPAASPPLASAMASPPAAVASDSAGEGPTAIEPEWQIVLNGPEYAAQPGDAEDADVGADGEEPSDDGAAARERAERPVAAEDGAEPSGSGGGGGGAQRGSRRAEAAASRARPAPAAEAQRQRPARASAPLPGRFAAPKREVQSANEDEGADGGGAGDGAAGPSGQEQTAARGGSGGGATTPGAAPKRRSRSRSDLANPSRQPPLRAFLEAGLLVAGERRLAVKYRRARERERAQQQTTVPVVTSPITLFFRV